MNIPEKISGDHIYLRRLKKEDQPHIQHALNNKKIGKWLQNVPHPFRANDAKKYIQERQTLMKKKKSLNLAIVHKKNKCCIGTINLHHFNKKHRRAELSYWLEESYWGKGMASETLKLMLEHVFKKIRLHRIYANVCKTNKRSVHVLKKNGFIHEGTKRSTRKMGNKYYDVEMYSLLENEYQSSPKT